MARRLHPPDPPLRGDDFVLEPITDARHAPGVARWATDDDIAQFTLIPDPMPESFPEEWLGRFAAGWRDGSRAGFLIVADDKALAGFIGVVRLEREARQGEIGYIVDPVVRSRGLATGALRLVSEWALTDLGLARVELRITPENETSARVAERCGFIREGVLRSMHFKQGMRTDLEVWSLLPGDLR